MLPTETPVPLILVADWKDYFFETFPKKWQQAFHNTKSTDFYNATEEDIMQFMKRQRGTQTQKKNKGRKRIRSLTTSDHATKEEVAVEVVLVKEEAEVEVAMEVVTEDANKED